MDMKTDKNGNKVPDWDKIRAGAFAPESPPPDWPQTVRLLSWNGTALFGIDTKTRELCWDGAPIMTRKRWSNFERTIAVMGLLAAWMIVVVEVGRALGCWS